MSEISDYTQNLILYSEKLHYQVYFYDSVGLLVASTTTSFCRIDDRYETYINAVFDENS